MINFERISDDICTQGFHIIDGFLEHQQCQDLRSIAEDMHQKGLFRQAKIGQKIEAQLNNTIRADEICWIDEQSSEPAIQAYLKQSILLANWLNHSLYLRLNEFETHFAAYQPGAFYRMHTDQFANKKTRKISCVYYLNEHWQESYGGELKLYTTDYQLIKSVLPQGNRFICFNSELPHEVCITNQKRYSMTGWMKTV